MKLAINLFLPQLELVVFLLELLDPVLQFDLEIQVLLPHLLNSLLGLLKIKFHIVQLLEFHLELLHLFFQLAVFLLEDRISVVGQLYLVLRLLFYLFEPVSTLLLDSLHNLLIILLVFLLLVLDTLKLCVEVP